MNDNLEKFTSPKSYRTILLVWLVSLKRIALYALGVAGITAISFIFSGKFSARSYSDRLFLIGIIIMMIGIFTFITMVGTRKNMGFSTIIKNEEEARNLLDKTDELREKTEKRYDLGSQIWSIGMACLVYSILFYYVLRVFTI